MLVMTPRWEGLPLLPLEAMFMNVPVVSTATGGIRSDDRLRNSIINNANRVAHERFSQDAMLAQIEQCYQELQQS